MLEIVFKQHLRYPIESIRSASGCYDKVNVHRKIGEHGLKKKNHR